MIKHGIRTSLGIRFLIEDIIMFDNTITSTTAIPMARPFSTDVVTASAGHIPKRATNRGF
jgi:hypothetical protein